ncbi:MAG: DUF692 family protein [Anaerolineaceae bacterium]|jgi:sugar phosphate isomerase/epimerase|nr:DUF692 family protein [Anaerolineaceae bacterium]MDD4042975.1 DUF692 family protein [Anaerolineaceae bacterium]MDD4577512.1 DUF692 family protein [Anaerolineaceae bacterium]
MKFAVNYSTHLGDLLKEGAVKVDLLKCPEWDGIVNAALPLGRVYIHFEISVGANNIQSLNFGLIDRFLNTTDTPHLNIHLSNDLALEADSPENRKAMLRLWKKDLASLSAAFPGVKIVAENLPWHEFLPHLRMAADPDLIRAIIEDCDLGLLLDLSHAQISANAFGMDFKDYIARLPLGRLSELHITGIREYANFPTDHFELQPDDWQVVNWAAEQIRAGAWRQPEIVAYEYGGIGDVFCWRTERSALQEQVPLLYDIFGEISLAT